MPIYEYRCECGATLEVLERVGVKRERCLEDCQRSAKSAAAVAVANAIAVGEGRVERILSAPGIRGDGREAKEPTFDPVKRSNRPGCEDCNHDG